MFCEKCGKELPEIAKFCDKCGHPVAAAPAPQAEVPKETPTPAAPVNTPPRPQAPVQNAPVFPNAYVAPKAPISVGGWIGRSLIPMIPFVGAIIYFIMLFVWAGDKTKEESFNNWAKAQLWVMLISVVLLILFIVVFGALIASLVNSML